MTAPTLRLLQGGNQPRPAADYLREYRAEYSTIPPTDPRCDLAYRRALLAAARVDAESLEEFAAEEVAFERPAFRPVTLRESIDARLDACASVYSEALRVADLLTAIDRAIDVLDGKTGLMPPFDANLEAQRMLNAARKVEAE
jgi:hypothetical protein